MNKFSTNLFSSFIPFFSSLIIFIVSFEYLRNLILEGTWSSMMREALTTLSLGEMIQAVVFMNIFIVALTIPIYVVLAPALGSLLTILFFFFARKESVSRKLIITSVAKNAFLSSVFTVCLITIMLFLSYMLVNK